MASPAVTARTVASLAACLLIGPVAGTACADSQKAFTAGRLRTTCNNAIPVCDDRASCHLSNDEYVRGRFPGGRKVVVRARSERARLRVRFLFEKMVAPGTELLIRAHSPDCSDFEQRRPTDVDFFERAGDDRILGYTLPLKGRGDHLVEVFSDMSAKYVMTTTVE
ncbi:MAG: hypothetical protein ABEL76_09200 [Bradymonadaceae bacterium]